MDFFPLEIETFLINSEKGIKVDPQTENSWRGRVLKNLFVFFLIVNLAMLLMLFWQLNTFI